MRKKVSEKERKMERVRERANQKDSTNERVCQTER